MPDTIFSEWKYKTRGNLIIWVPVVFVSDVYQCNFIKGPRKERMMANTISHEWEHKTWGNLIAVENNWFFC
jgi:hypothetical protein